jgi:hypothetical protein
MTTTNRLLRRVWSKLWSTNPHPWGVMVQEDKTRGRSWYFLSCEIKGLRYSIPKEQIWSLPLFQMLSCDRFLQHEVPIPYPPWPHLLISPKHTSPTTSPYLPTSSNHSVDPPPLSLEWHGGEEAIVEREVSKEYHLDLPHFLNLLAKS